MKKLEVNNNYVKSFYTAVKYADNKHYTKNTTVPAEVVKELNIKVGDKIRWTIQKQGNIINYDIEIIKDSEEQANNNNNDIDSKAKKENIQIANNSVNIDKTFNIRTQKDGSGYRLEFNYKNRRNYITRVKISDDKETADKVKLELLQQNKDAIIKYIQDHTKTKNKTAEKLEYYGLI